jgi:hypothetical protein
MFRDFRFSKRSCWTFQSSDMWRHVVGRVGPDVSNDRTAFTFMVKQYGRTILWNVWNYVTSGKPSVFGTAMCVQFVWTATLLFGLVISSFRRTVVTACSRIVESKKKLLYRHCENLGNVGNHSPNHTTSHVRRLQFSATHRCDTLKCLDIKYFAPN